MKIKIVALIALFLVGCGKKDEAPSRNMSVDFYVSKFYALAKANEIDPYIKTINISLVDLDRSKNIVGRCYYSNPRRIVLDKNWWNSQGISDTSREELIFHEMGHCILGRDHTTADSVMTPEILESSIYLANRDYYIRELFDETLSTQNNAMSAAFTIEKTVLPGSPSSEGNHDTFFTESAEDDSITCGNKSH